MGRRESSSGLLKTAALGNDFRCGHVVRSQVMLCLSSLLHDLLFPSLTSVFKVYYLTLSVSLLAIISDGGGTEWLFF